MLTKRLKDSIRVGILDPLRVLAWQKDLPRTTSFSTRRELFAGGFKGAAHVIYGLDRNNRRDYLSDLANRRLNRKIKNSTTSAIMKNKLLAPLILEEYFKVPDVLAVVVRGEISPLRKDTEVRDMSTLLEHCHSSDGVIIKPSDGRQGRGVISLKVKEGDLYISGRKTQQSEFDQLISSLNNYQIESFVKQADYASKIYSPVTNSIRVVTMRDPDQDGKPFIAFAVHKFGTKQSAPVDNWAKGGLCALVNLETGELGPSAGYPEFTGGKLTWFDQHPETRSRITGVFVPGWSALKEQLLDMLEALKFLLYIGWDIVITPQGPCVIEGNTFPSVSFLQVHKPLLKDPRIKRFYTYYEAF